MIFIAYEDDGPAGPCGQTVEATSPWRRLYRVAPEHAVELMNRLEGQAGRRRARIVGMYSDDERDCLAMVQDWKPREPADPG